MKLQLDMRAAGCSGLYCDLSAADSDDKDPNAMPFTGVLLVLDQPSDKPPHGSEGHRIYVPTNAAKKRLNTLIGKGLNYSPDLQQHSPRRKVGVITGAWIDGKKLMVKGTIWKKDFPDAERDLKQGRLGMSMELANVYVRDKDDKVWYLEDFYFSGATVLYKSAAAYYATALAAASAVLGNEVKSGGRSMAKKVQTKKAADTSRNNVQILAAALAPALKSAVEGALKPVVNGLNAQGLAIKSLAKGINQLHSIQAAAIEADLDALAAEGEDEEEEKEEEQAVTAAARRSVKAQDEEPPAEDDDDDEDVEAEGDEDDGEDDDEDVEAALENLEDKAPEEDVGEINKDAENQGDKTTVTAGRVRKAMTKPLVHASARVGNINAAAHLVRRVLATNARLRQNHQRTVSKMYAQAAQIEAIEAQLEQYAERVDRRSVSPEVRNLLEKGGHDVRELMASGQQLPVQEVDRILQQTGLDIDVTTRMWIKNQLMQAGLMDTGMRQ